MSESKNADIIMFSKIAEGLDSTSKLVHALLNEIKDSEADFVAVKTELSNLRENVKKISEIISEENGAASLITQVAMIQEKLISIDKVLEKHSEKVADLEKRIVENKPTEIEKDLYIAKTRIQETSKVKLVFTVCITIMCVLIVVLFMK